MKVKRLSGPKTHICWTPDAIPERKRELVSLAREADLLALEALAEDLRVDLLAEIDRAEKAENKLADAIGLMKRLRNIAGCCPEQVKDAIDTFIHRSGGR